MKRTMVLAGIVAGAVFASYVAFSPAGHAGGCCGGAAGEPFCCGAGPKTADVPWDDSIPVPAEKSAAAAKDADKSAPSWTADDLKNGRPLFVYYYVKDLADVKDESYKLAQKFEVMGLPGDGVLPALKKDWRAKKVTIDAAADHKDPKNQAHIEFWSFTGVKLAEVTAKDDGGAAPKPLLAKLQSLAGKNRDLCNAEIKRIEAAAKATPKSGK